MRRILPTLLAVGALGAVGCQSREDRVTHDREQLAKTQAQANADMARARAKADEQEGHIERDTAKRISDDRAHVAEARTQLLKDERQLELDEAQARRNVHGEDAHPILAPHRDTSAAMEDGAAPQHTRTGTLTGTLAQAHGTDIVVRDFNGNEVKLKADSRTHVMQHGREVSLDRFREGTEVRASYMVDGHDRVARDVQVLSQGR